MATVSLTVTAVNDPPTAQPLAATTNEDTPLVGQVAATDPDSPALTYAVVTGPAHGSLTLNADGTFTYVSTPDYVGSDSVTFKANDGQLDSNVATVSLTVTAVNDPPTAQPLAVTTAENARVSGRVTATDPDSLVLTYAVVAGPAHGTLQFKSDGTFTYTPGTNYYGPDSVTFKANDGQADSNTATVSITVTHVNQPPVAQPLAVTTTKGTALSSRVTATDPDSPVLTYAVVTGPRHGTLRFKSDGTFTYTPAPNYVGSDSFTFKANDGQLNSNVATVSITIVRWVNQPPRLAPASITVRTNAPQGTIVGTVTGADPDGDPLTYSILGGNTSGAFAIDSKSGRITVANRSTLNGKISSFSLTVQVRDPGGLTATAVIRINVT